MGWLASSEPFSVQTAQVQALVPGFVEWQPLRVFCSWLQPSLCSTRESFLQCILQDGESSDGGADLITLLSISSDLERGGEALPTLSSTALAFWHLEGSGERGRWDQHLGGISPGRPSCGGHSACRRGAPTPGSPSGCAAAPPARRLRWPHESGLCPLEGTAAAPPAPLLEFQDWSTLADEA